METEKVLTVPEAAHCLAVHPKTVYNLLARGKLPGVKVGRVWRIHADVLDAFLRGYRKEVSDFEPT
ncbi:helix-turn-helix domain-containing protein [Zhaonella formicivorans]|jgi:excisionase family DNA binding protein|uniref:helix-turn-helix domain-containing protein n=1 Tax=Zhaonella formicivorans TaxID=2528593 RepID=UPI0010CE6704|nr:helix-turn-helix domain-containing protein [Zhaonella formicivorans]